MGFDSIWIVGFEDLFFKLNFYTLFPIHHMSFNVFFPLEIGENCISNLLDMDMWPSKSTSRDTTSILEWFSKTYWTNNKLFK
jgi:hypothetical protein